MRGRMRAVAVEEDVGGGHVRRWLLTMVGRTLHMAVGSESLTSIRLVIFERERTIRAIYLSI
jgi:hypothetical protein